MLCRFTQKNSKPNTIRTCKMLSCLSYFLFVIICNVKILSCFQKKKKKRNTFSFADIITAFYFNVQLIIIIYYSYFSVCKM